MQYFRTIFAVIFFGQLFLNVNGHLDFCITAGTEFKDEKDAQPLIKYLLEDFLRKSDDSIIIPHLDFNFTHPAISANGSFDNLTVYNFSNYHFVPDISNGLNMSFVIDNISVKGQYDMFGNIGDLFNIFGKGDFWMNLKDFSVQIVFNVIINSKLCFTLDTYVVLENLDGHFDDLMNDDELEDLLNKAFTTLAPEIIEELWKEFKEIVDGLRQEAIDEYFKNTVTDFQMNQKQISL